MEKRGPMPNDATFVSILPAYTQSGMVLEGWWCFSLMSRIYNIQTKVEHYACMVYLLARAGLVMDSGELFKEVPIVAGSSLWGALLSARRTHSHMELREMAAEHLIELEPTDVVPYGARSTITPFVFQSSVIPDLIQSLKTANVYVFRTQGEATEIVE
ncbi:hypothetical protein NL676_010435 [Syzygium grande]|nr:hypothetical protein NL676_010435 [Syzygium grande]